MGDMGLGNAFGSAGAADALRQLIQDRLAKQQQEFTNNRLTANDARQAEEHAAAMASLADQRKAAQAQMQEGDAAKIAPMLSVNQSLPPMIAGRLRNTMQGANMADNPPLAQPPNMPGMMQPDIVPGDQPGADWKGTDAQRSGEEQKVLRGRLINNPDLTDRERLMINMENAGLKVPANMEAKPTVRQPVQVGPQGIFTDPADAIGKPGYHPPQQQQTVTIQTVDESGNKVTKVVPKKDAIGKTFAGAPTGQEANRKSMATSVGARFDDLQTQLDEANKRGLLGPGAGRVSEFLAGKVGSTGNPENDDLLGELRMNLSAVRSGFASLHGRGGANAGIAKELLDKMDSGHMSHAELTGALRGMKKWVDDYAGKSQDGATGKPTAEDLIKKYGGD
jgi:hypothetical protein